MNREQRAFWAKEVQKTAQGKRRNERQIHRSLIGRFAAALVLITLCPGPIAADPRHHPGGGTPSPVQPGGAPTGVPVAPPGTAPFPSAPMTGPAAPSAAPGMPGGSMGEMIPPAGPGAAVPAPNAGGPSAAGGMAPAASGSCMGGNCGTGAATTPIYPSLMTLPALTPEKRAEIDALASQQMNEGRERLVKASGLLDRATQAGDHAAMQEAVGMMREGLDELGAGIAARRVLLEGKAPRNLALDWFKREMNLASPVMRDEPRALLGVTPFHLFTMGLLIAFALAMVAMYFFKMRRTAALFGRIAPDPAAPPPGTAPPLAGGPGSSSPAAPLGAGVPPAAPATPAAGTPPASVASPAGSPAIRVPGASSAPPPTANWRGQLRVGSVVTETPRVKTFRLLPSADERHMPFTFLPGQFLNVAFGIGGARMNRSYSISSSPTQREHVDLTVQREPRGAISRHMNDLLKRGDRIEAGGPVGKFTFTGTEADSIVLIAGGVGITPMMSITRYLTESAWVGEIYLIFACRAPIDYIFENDIAALQRLNPKLHVAVIMEHPEGTDWKGLRGRITGELLTQTVPDLASRRIHLCGPASMMDATKAILTGLGVAPEQVKTELFGATKPIPGALGTSSKPTALATGPLVTFSKNNKSSKIRADQTVLELSEELGIGIEFSCRIGTCGVCKVKMTSGEVEMAVEDALEPDDKIKGIILACQAKPKGAVTVEA